MERALRFGLVLWMVAALLPLAAPLAGAAAGPGIALTEALGQFPVRSEFNAQEIVWANLTWSSAGGGIVFDGTPSPEAEGSATAADPVLEAKLTAQKETWGYARTNIGPLLADEVFTSPVLETPLFLNVSQNIEIDIFVKGVGDNVKPCQTSGNTQQNVNPALNVHLMAGDQRVGTWLAVGYFSKAYSDGPNGWGICRHRIAPEMHVIPAGVKLTLRVVHIKQDTVYPFGFAGDHRSVLRIPVFPLEEIVYRHPEYLEAAGGTDESDSGAGGAFFALGALPLPLALAGRGRRKAVAMALLVVGLAMAGCLTSSKKDDAPPGAVDTDDGKISNTFVPITEPVGQEPGRGSIFGLVHDDLHIPVPGVHVSVLGRSDFTETDSKGRFKLVNLPVGVLKLRFDKAEYRSFEAEVEVKQGFASNPTIELHLVNPKSRDARPHVHNGWLGIPDGRKTLMDQELELKCDDQNRCTTYRDFVIPGKGNQTNSIMPGTKDVRVTLTWSDAKLGQRLGLAVHAPHETTSPTKTWSLYEPRESGKEFMIPVSWEKDDPGHQLISSWKFQIFRAPPDYPTAVDDKQEENLPSGGRIRVKLEIIQGGALPLEPPHPDHWAGSTSYQVVKAAENALPACAVTEFGHCDFAVEYKPDPKKLVPPATKRLLVEMEPDRASTPPFDWDLYVQSAAVPYTDPSERGLGKFQKIERDSSSTSTKYVWKVTVADHESDPQYAEVSGWTFVLYPEDTNAAFLDNAPSSMNRKMVGNGLTLKVVAYQE